MLLPVNKDKYFSIPMSGQLCDGCCITLAWPEPYEFDLITVLRNLPNVRKWFLDDRLIDVVKNRIWLEHGMKRPTEAILSIRWKQDGSFLGTIGWSDWDLISKTAWFGRLAVDTDATKKIRDKLPSDYGGVAIDAALALRDFAFISMGLDAALTYYFSDNKLAELVNKSIGLLETRRVPRASRDGFQIETVEMKMTRQQWEVYHIRGGKDDK